MATRIVNYKGKRTLINPDEVVNGAVYASDDEKAFYLDKETALNLPLWVGRQPIPSEDRKVRRWLSLPKNLWALIDAEAEESSHHKLIERILEEHLVDEGVISLSRRGSEKLDEARERELRASGNAYILGDAKVFGEAQDLPELRQLLNEKFIL